MPRKNEPPEKEVYRLWWEYLKRSQDYKRYCELTQGKTEKEIDEIAGDLYIENKDNKGIGWILLDTVFIHFGNIHLQSFEDWWEKRGKFTTKPEEPELKIVDDRDILQSLLGELKIRDKRNISFEELKNIHPRVFHTKQPVSMYFYVRVTYKTPVKIDFKQMEIKFSALVKDILRRNPHCYHPQLKPTKPIRFDELKRYLRVHTLRSAGKKWKEVFTDIYPEIEKQLTDETLAYRKYEELLQKKESRERSLYEEFEKARAIIKNVEQGIFPGKY